MTLTTSSTDDLDTDAPEITPAGRSVAVPEC